LAHNVPDFIQIGSLSAELLPNVWRLFLPRRVFTNYRAIQARLFEPIKTHVLISPIFCTCYLWP